MTTHNFILRDLLRLVSLALLLSLSACERSHPGASQIQSYIENYQIAHDFKVASMDYEVEPEQRGESGRIRVSGKLELREPLYVEDLGSRQFHKRVATMLRRNRFSEREISHEIYDRVIRATARVENRENEYYTFLKEEYAPGYAINFSADLKYTKGIDGYMLDGTVNHPKLLGARLIKFTNPVVDDGKLVEKAVKAVLAEQARYRELMKASSAVLSRLWDNEHGLIVWNRKISYLGNENLTPEELAQLRELTNWRAVFRISNIRPVQFNTPHASNFFELGNYTTEGVATCLRQTGFARELTYSKSDFDQYCEFGKQYPAVINLASLLNETNEFEASVEFDVEGVSSGILKFKAPYFQREENEVARYSDLQRVQFLEEPFDIRAHNRPIFKVVKSVNSSPDLLRLHYTGTTDYAAIGFDAGSNNEFLVGDEEGKEDASLADQSVSTNDETSVSQAAPNSVSTPSKRAEPVSLSESPSKSKESSKNAEPETGTGASTNGPLTQVELVKAIQVELKRLNVYTARIDGIAGAQTFWAMNYVQDQLGITNITKPSQEFLSLLKDTPVTAVTLPGKEDKPVVTQEPEKKKTFGAWFSGLFKKKKDKPKRSDSN